ncbi:MAG: hypothetical protein JSR60_10980 [Proteobacteria bacterium]|nr:hypothetical protein [Pseudomonadota bacterium]
MDTLRLVLGRIPALFALGFRALAASLAALLAWAFAGLIAVLACLALTPVLGPLVLGPMAVMFVAAHALYAIYASRRIARAIDPVLVEPITPGHWVGATIGIALLTMAVALPFAVWLPNMFMSVIVLAAVLTATPLLPELALKPGDLRAALGDAGRYPLRFLPTAAILAAPCLALAELIGWAVITRPASWGLLDGGYVTLAFLGAHTFIATTTAALVSTLVYAAERDERGLRASAPRAVAILLTVIVACGATAWYALRPPDESSFTMLGSWQSNGGYTITLNADHTYRFCDRGACMDGRFQGPAKPHGTSVILSRIFSNPKTLRFRDQVIALGGLWGPHGNIADFEFGVTAGIGGVPPAWHCGNQPCVLYGDDEDGPYLAFTKSGS